MKQKVPSEFLYEIYMYHGSTLKNHQKIVKEHFIIPKNNDKKLDDGFYGRGINATDNIFYASMYSLGYKSMSVNEKASVFCCKIFFNTDKMIQIENMQCRGIDIYKDVADSFGIHTAFVGSKNNFHGTILEYNMDENFIYANEFVFANEYQIVPVCSLTVMRPKYYILWFDEKLEGEYDEHLKQMRKNIEVNIYVKRKLDEAKELVNLKKEIWLK